MTVHISPADREMVQLVSAYRGRDMAAVAELLEAFTTDSDSPHG